MKKIGSLPSYPPTGGLKTRAISGTFGPLFTSFPYPSYPLIPLPLPL